MNYKSTTQTPNKLFDLLPSLGEKELKLLLVVIRQTYGWIDGKGGRKKKDYISQKFFIQKSGLSRKSVSIGIANLITKELIQAQSASGELLHHPKQRKRRMRIFYSPMLGDEQKLLIKRVKSSPVYVENRNTTKLKPTKLKCKKASRLSDYDRYQQICDVLADKKNSS